MVGEVEIVHPQPYAFHQTQTCPVEQTGHESVHAAALCEHRLYFCRGKDGRHALWAFGTLDLAERRERLLQHMAVEKEEGVSGAILRGSGHFPVHGEVREKGPDFWRAHLFGMTLVVKKEKALGPGDIGFLRAQAHMFEA